MVFYILSCHLLLKIVDILKKILYNFVDNKVIYEK